MKSLWLLLLFCCFSNPFAEGASLVQVVSATEKPLSKSMLESQLKISITKLIQVQVDPDLAPEWNGGEIAYSLKRLREPVILLAQGKAAADTLELLLIQPPGVEWVKQFVAWEGWLSGPGRDVQLSAVPFGLSQDPQSEAPELIRDMHNLIELVLHFWNPERKHQLAMTGPIRKRRLKEQKLALQRLNKKIPLTLIGTEAEHRIPGFPLLPPGSKTTRISASL